MVCICDHQNIVYWFFFNFHFRSQALGPYHSSIGVLLYPFKKKLVYKHSSTFSDNNAPTFCKPFTIFFKKSKCVIWALASLVLFFGGWGGKQTGWVSNGKPFGLGVSKIRKMPNFTVLACHICPPKKRDHFFYIFIFLNFFSLFYFVKTTKTNQPTTIETKNKLKTKFKVYKAIHLNLLHNLQNTVLINASLSHSFSFL